MRIFVSLVAATAFLGFAAVLAGAQDGTALYQKNCASCHGPDGKAQTPAGKAMKVPAIAGTTLTPEQVLLKLKGIDKHKAVTSKLSDAELIAIAKAIPPGS